jgi:hypothetical protein
VAGERAPGRYSGTISQQIDRNPREVGCRILHLGRAFGLGSCKSKKAFIDEITEVLPLSATRKEAQQSGSMSSIDFGEGRIPHLAIGDTGPFKALNVPNHKLPPFPSRGFRLGMPSRK